MPKLTGKPLRDALKLLEEAAELLKKHGNNADAGRLRAVAQTWSDYYGE